MRMSENLRGLLSEFSALLAGFKLGMILIGWFGFGSVAKWVIEHWYPFTRWIWDMVAISFNFPALPIAVKDSLTALVFFLPLGLTALFLPRSEDAANQSKAIRLVALFLGIALLLVVSKDAIGEILKGREGAI